MTKQTKVRGLSKVITEIFTMRTVIDFNLLAFGILEKKTRNIVIKTKYTFPKLLFNLSSQTIRVKKKISSNIIYIWLTGVEQNNPIKTSMTSKEKLNKIK